MLQAVVFPVRGSFMSYLILVKHALPEIIPTLPANQWHLSEVGRTQCALLGRVDELFDANPHGNEMYQSQKGLAQFLIPRGDTSKLFEIVEEPFYLLTELVEVFIIV